MDLQWKCSVSTLKYLFCYSLRWWFGAHIYGNKHELWSAIYGIQINLSPSADSSSVWTNIPKLVLDPLGLLLIFRICRNLKESGQ